jgi:hypothetical protein
MCPTVSKGADYIQLINVRESSFSVIFIRISMSDNWVILEGTSEDCRRGSNLLLPQCDKLIEFSDRLSYYVNLALEIELVKV